MTDAQIVAVYRCLKDFNPDLPFSMSAAECRAALLAQYPGHATVEDIFTSGALTEEYRAEAYAKFEVEP